MVDSLLGKIKCKEISRLNIIFDIGEKYFYNLLFRNLDSWIGRTAHVKYLSDKDFIKKFFMAFEESFTLP